MYTAQIRFLSEGTPTAAAVEAVSSLLAALYKNGQVSDARCPVVATDRDVTAFATLPTADALEARYINVYGRAEAARLAEHGLSGPNVTVVGQDPTLAPACRCATRSGMVLHTTSLTRESPLRCGTCFAPVPLIALPHRDDQELLDLLRWEADFKACDTLQLHSTVGVRFAERQLAGLDSALTRSGRALCRDLEAATGLPVYYALPRIRGRSRRSERERPCPGCGGAWRLPEPWLGRFDFRCDVCRLVSHLAWDVAG